MALSSLSLAALGLLRCACSDLSYRVLGSMVGVHNLPRLHALVFHSLRAIGPIVLWFPPLSAICRTTLLTCIDPVPRGVTSPRTRQSMLSKKQ
ncbi:MAG: hypothetical protein J3Q66DRAFT_336419 [Benniella sp.]|nr:MAG: hypothetical protein J3Q66DRAFT_336419 [Benniella sp.]